MRKTSCIAAKIKMRKREVLKCLVFSPLRGRGLAGRTTSFYTLARLPTLAFDCASDACAIAIARGRPKIYTRK